RAAARAELEAWAAASPAPSAEQVALRRRYLEHLGVPGALERDGAPDHLTASALVLDPAGERTLLVLHRRGGFWVQPGGHVEPGDAGLVAAGLRELVEETGVPASAVRAGPHPVDLHHHELSAAFGRCRSHLDVAVLAVVDPEAATTASVESDAVAWWPLERLPDGADGGPAVAADLPARLRRAAEELRQGAREGRRGPATTSVSPAVPPSALPSVPPSAPSSASSCSSASRPASPPSRRASAADHPSR
ncbi:NUDIX domain-containing protein, partial [Pseudokineococcus marinus]|nr:NUDIX domain-containing protein [Pseudokineococcus marinus]